MIDSHVHFWNFDAERDSWITEDMGIIRNDFMPSDFITATSETPINACIAVQADQSEEQNHFLLNLAKQSDAIKGIVGWVDLLNPNLEERLSFYKNHTLIKGFRHVLQAETDDFISAEKLAQGIRTLHKFGYTYDLLCYHTQLNAIQKLVDQLTNQPLILDHCGKPDVKNQDLLVYDRNIERLAKNQNVYCKISGLLAEADWKNWTEKEIFSCFDIIFKHFGVDRILYGSDWPVMLISRPYKDWYNLANKYLAQFSEAEKLKIFGGNASRFYGL